MGDRKQHGIEPVASGTFEKTSFSWQIQQFQQRIGEWLERVFAHSSEDNVTPYNWQIPDWLQRGLFWLVVISLIVWAGWQLYQLLQPYLFNYFHLRDFSPPLTSARTPELTTLDWLKRSRQAHQQGNYREACRALYMATLQHLNDNNLIQQEPSRTDGEYLNLIQGSLIEDLSVSQPYQLLIRTHERLCFSDAAISAEIFDRCWQAYREIERAEIKERKLEIRD